MLQFKNLLQKIKPVKVNHLFPLVVGLPHALGGNYYRFTFLRGVFTQITLSLLQNKP